MKKCLYCNSEFEEVVKRRLFCSSKCRTYASRCKIKNKTKDWKYVIDKNNVKFVIDERIALKLAVYFGLDVRTPKKNKVAKNSLKNDKIKTNKIISKKNDINFAKKVGINSNLSSNIRNKNIVDYRREFNLCEFPEDFKLLWEKISKDGSITENEKKLWRIEFGIK